MLFMLPCSEEVKYIIKIKWEHLAPPQLPSPFLVELTLEGWLLHGALTSVPGALQAWHLQGIIPQMEEIRQ